MRHSLANLYRVFCCSLAASLPQSVFGQVFDGPGLQGGLDAASNINGPIHGEPRAAVLRLLATVLSYVALAATVMIVIAGIILIASLGNDEAKNKAKNILKYLAIGLLVILFARAIVGFFLIVLPGEVSSS